MAPKKKVGEVPVVKDASEKLKPKGGQNASTLKEAGLEKMPQKDLTEMLGWMKYHGETKKKPGHKPSTRSVWEKFTFGNRINLGAKVYKAYCEQNNIDKKKPVKFHTPNGDVIKCLDQGSIDQKPFWSKLPHASMAEGDYF